MSKRIIFFVIFTFALSTQLASAFDDRPLFVTITSDSCYSCKKLEPVLEELKTEYDSQIEFVTLKISTRDEIREAAQVAADYGIAKFFNENKSTVPKVGIFCPRGTKVEKEFLAETKKEVYIEELNKLLSDTSSVCSL